MDLVTAIKLILNGQALLILGAGASADAINLLGETMPVGTLLAKQICNNVLNDNDWNYEEDKLEYMADRCLERDLADKLCEFLRNSFKVKSLNSNGYNIIAGLPWQNVYTTNYDNVFETASAMVGVSRVPVVPTQKYADFANVNRILHINGYIESLTTRALDNEFKLSSTSFLLESFQNQSPEWFKLLQNDIDVCSCIILVGVSFHSDLDLQRLIYDENDYKNKTVFIDIKSKTHDPRLKFGSVHTIGIAGFANEIEIVKQDYVPQKNMVNYGCFKFVTSKTLRPNPTLDSTSRRQLLLKGYIDPNILWSHLNDNEYLFHRTENEMVTQALEKNESRCICITANLANGKTCLVNLVALDMVSKGWDVFFFEHTNSNFNNEVNSFKTTENKTLIIFESYQLYFKELKKVVFTLHNKNVYLLLTSRTFINTTVASRLSEDLERCGITVDTLNLDDLSTMDTDKAIQLFEKADLFLQYAGLSLKQKRQLFRGTYHSSQFSSALMNITKSDHIQKEIRTIYEKIESVSIAHDLLIATAILSVVGFSIRLNSLLSVLDLRSVPQGIMQDKDLAELVQFKDGTLFSHSTTFSKFILHNLARNSIIEVLEKINRNASKLPSESETSAVRKSLITFSNINLLLPIKGVRDSNVKKIMEYYYDMRQMHCYDHNPFFWLQYAMAAMENYDYDRAIDLLTEGYRCADKQKYDFDTVQIDTQKARCILEMIVYYKQYDSEKFTEAKNLLEKAANSRKGQLRLIIKQVITGYNAYFIEFNTNIEHEDKTKIYNSIDFFLRKIYTHNEVALKRNFSSDVIPNHSIQLLCKLKDQLLISVVSTQ